jgi:hypothetical protein
MAFKQILPVAQRTGLRLDKTPDVLPAGLYGALLQLTTGNGQNNIANAAYVGIHVVLGAQWSYDGGATFVLGADDAVFDGGNPPGKSGMYLNEVVIPLDAQGRYPTHVDGFYHVYRDSDGADATAPFGVSYEPILTPAG